MRNNRHHLMGRGGHGRHFTHPALLDCIRGDDHGHHGPFGGRHGHGRGHGRGGRRGGRLFDYGELRLLVLALLSDNPSHGYELIKGIEERFGGSYSPSPGVIYPTLSWLEDMGYAELDATEGTRKRYRATEAGTAFLESNRPAVDALLARGEGAGDHGRPGGIPAPMIRAMENLKTALRLRMRAGPLDDTAIEAIAAAIDAAAHTVEKN